MAIAGKQAAQAPPPKPDKAASDMERMQAAISARAPRFSLGALLDALRALGYGDDEIELRSNKTNAHQASLVSAVRFSGPPRRRATVVLNLGLLGPQSLLPSYFQKVLDAQQEGALSGFLNFFAHRLLRGSAHAQFPERDPELFADWPETLAQLRSLLGVRTLYSVHRVFEQLYPELGVAVQRIRMMRPVRSRGTRLGPWALGDGAVLGGVAQVPVSGIGVRLLSDEAVTGRGEPWARAAVDRLHQKVFPLLARHGLHLEISLILRDQRSFMVLRPNQFLGYVPLYSGPGASTAARSARTIILWSGEVPTSPSP